MKCQGKPFPYQQPCLDWHQMIGLVVIAGTVAQPIIGAIADKMYNIHEPRSLFGLIKFTGGLVVVLQS